MSYKFKEITVLIVDKQPHIITLIRGVLKMFGVQNIFSASTQEVAMEYFQQEKPDLLIVDWEIASSSGIDFTKAIRQSSHNPYVPIVFMTSFTSEERVTQARDSGITEFLAKPFTVETLYKRIERIIEKPRNFVVAPNYVGPDRRRKKGEAPDGVERRKAEREAKAKYAPLPQDDVFKNRAKLRTATVVKPPNEIKKKIGTGGIDEKDFAQAQDYLKTNTVDFKPLGVELVKTLSAVSKQIGDGELVGEPALEALLLPAAQLKAQGALFHYTRVSNIAEILVEFLETVHDADKDVLDVVAVHTVAISYVLTHAKVDDGAALEKALEDSLVKACKRYYALKKL